MPVTAPIKTSDYTGFLTPDQAAPIFDDAVRQSAIMQMSQRVPLGSRGAAIPIMTKKPTANWTEEAGSKPVTDLGRTKKVIVPKKLTSIVVVSQEAIGEDSLGISRDAKKYMATAFANAFDWAAAYGVGGNGTGTCPFEACLADTTHTQELHAGKFYDDAVAGLKTLRTAKKRPTGFLFDGTAEIDLLEAKDDAGRPLFVSPTYTDNAEVLTKGRLLNRTAYLSEDFAPDGADVIGFAGDFSKTAWGAVGGIRWQMSTEATIQVGNELLHLFQENLVALLAEAWYGFVIADTDAFVKFTRADETEDETEEEPAAAGSGSGSGSGSSGSGS